MTKTLSKLAVVLAVVALCHARANAQTPADLPPSHFIDPAPMYGAACTSCTGGCGECGDCGCNVCCCDPLGFHRTGVFGEYLYLRPRDAEVAYGVAIDGPITNPPQAFPLQIGPVGVVDQGYTSGYRAGFVYNMDNCSSVAVTYTSFDSFDTNAIATNAPNVIRSYVAHPGSQSADSDFLSAAANEGIDFRLIDADYRQTWVSGDNYAIYYLLGARYARLTQDFSSIFVDNGTETVTSRLNFEGGGLRLGLQGERANCRGMLVYGKTNASFVAGKARGTYAQGTAFDASIVNTSWEAGRIVTMLDLELGVGWQSRCGKYRATVGYLINGWFNVVKTDEFIKAVQGNNFVNLGDAMTFDGFVGRFEMRF